jgi:DNA-binding phage protein
MTHEMWLEMPEERTQFWIDLEEKLTNPEYLREYIVESIKVRSIDKLMNTLDDARIDAGVSKADLARSINARPEAIRRLFSQDSPNPTLSTVVEVAAALGYEISVQPLERSKRNVVTTALRQGSHTDLGRVARELAS